MKKTLFLLAFAVVFAFGFTTKTSAPIPADYTYQLVIPSDNVPEMINVFSVGWEAQVQDGVDGNGDPIMIANPQSKAQFAAEFFDHFIRTSIHQRVKRYRKGLLPAIDDTKITG